ncbi:MAG: translation initiation factor IF-2 N-terminal domain-containing protein, partial [Acidobacteriota bacterium]
MDQLRVVDLAHTMGITSRELIFKLRSIGVTVASEEDTLDLATVRAIITGETLQRRPREVIVRREKTEESSSTVSAKDRLARRRKRQVVETSKEIKEVVTEDKPAEEEFETTPAEVETEIAAEAIEVEEIAEMAADAAAAVAEAMVEEPTEADIEDEVELEPPVEITEEEITAERDDGDAEAKPQRVRPARAKTPLEQSLRELTADEI